MALRSHLCQSMSALSAKVVRLAKCIPHTVVTLEVLASLPSNRISISIRAYTASKKCLRRCWNKHKLGNAVPNEAVIATIYRKNHKSHSDRDLVSMFAQRQYLRDDNARSGAVFAH